jgi:hypothetical protein
MAPTEKIPVMLYNGTVNITFYPKSHRYYFDGNIITGVTTICGVVDKSEALMIWQWRLIENHLKSMPVEQRTDEQVDVALGLRKVFKEKAADIGSIVHSMIDQHIKGEEFSIDDEIAELPVEDKAKAKNWYLAFLKWESDTKPRWIKNEQIVYSKKFGYVGTFDAIAEIDGKIYLIDFKTAKYLYRLDHGMQTSAYVKAYEEEYGSSIDGRMILIFSKETGDFNVHDISDELEEDFVAFISAKNIHARKKKVDKFA